MQRAAPVHLGMGDDDVRSSMCTHVQINQRFTLPQALEVISEREFASVWRSSSNASDCLRMLTSRY